MSNEHTQRKPWRRTIFRVNFLDNSTEPALQVGYCEQAGFSWETLERFGIERLLRQPDALPFVKESKREKLLGLMFQVPC